MVKVHRLYQCYEQTRADDMAYSYTATYLEIENMADGDQGDAASFKEPGPNNHEEAAKFREATQKSLLKFIDSIHSFDRYKGESAYHIFVHEYRNELLKTGPSYYKN